MLYLGGISCHINVIEPPAGNVVFDHLFNEHLKLVISPWPQRFCSPSDQWPKVQFLMCPERRRRWSTEESPLPSSVKSRLVRQRCPENRWIKATKEEAWECTSTQDTHKKGPVWRHKQVHKWKESMIQLKTCFSVFFSILQRFTNSVCIPHDWGSQSIAMSHLNTLCLECLQSGRRSMSQRSSGPQWLPSFPRHLCQCIKRWHQLWASTLFHQAVLIRVIQKKTTKQPQHKMASWWVSCGWFFWVLWSIPSCLWYLLLANPVRNKTSKHYILQPHSLVTNCIRLQPI